MRTTHLFSLAALAALFLSLVAMGCGGDDDDDDSATDDDAGDDDDDDGECPEPTVDIAVCDPGAGPFSLTIDNEWFPLEVGAQLVLEGDEDGTAIRVEIDILDETEDVAGVTTRVVTETEYEDNELVEVSRNFFAQAPDGTVCYYGEDTTKYEDGDPSPGEDSWRAGDDGAEAGIIMPADPQVGDAYYQEYYPGNAEDMGEVDAFGEAISTPAGDFSDTMTMSDYNPLEGCGADEKVYVRGIGLAVDEEALLISY